MKDRCPTERYAYVGRVFRHEFGHTLGLPDFYDDPTKDHLNAVMNLSLDVEDADSDWLETFYAGHDPH